MPQPILTLDMIDGAGLTTRIGGGRHVRVGHIQNLPVSSANDFAWSIKALSVPGMPQMGQSHPNGDGTVVISHVFRGVSNDQARVEIIYDTPGGFEIPAGIFVIEDATTLTTRSALKIPGTDAYVRVYADPAKRDAIGDSVPLNYLAPLRTLTFRALINYRPSRILPSLVGNVNERAWQGLPAGYWMCSGVSAIAIAFDAQSKPGNYRMSGSFLTKQNEDWSDYQGLRGPDGRMVVVTDTELGTLTGKDYLQVRRNGGQWNVKNATRIAPYDTADFLNLFGF